LTIADTRSANGNGGLFFNSYEIEVNRTTPLDEPYRLIFRQPFQYQMVLETEGTRRLRPLFDRAWVFQERILSPRILHFGADELFYECNSGLWFGCRDIEKEAIAHGNLDPPTKTQYMAALERMTHAGDMNLDRGRLYQVAHLCRLMVTTYTDLLLTGSRDKLPALGGPRQTSKYHRKFTIPCWSLGRYI
jgi:hypothetical protein